MQPDTEASLRGLALISSLYIYLTHCPCTNAVSRDWLLATTRGSGHHYIMFCLLVCLFFYIKPFANGWRLTNLTWWAAAGALACSDASIPSYSHTQLYRIMVKQSWNASHSLAASPHCHNKRFFAHTHKHTNPSSPRQIINKQYPEIAQPPLAFIHHKLVLQPLPFHVTTTIKLLLQCLLIINGASFNINH